MEEKRLHKKLSVVTLPFNLIKKQSSNDAFDFKNNYKDFTNKDLIEFKSLLRNIESKDSLPIDSPKHHKFVSNHIGNIKSVDSSFLKVISVLPEYYNKLEEINFNPDVSVVNIKNTEWKVKFNNGTYILLNEFGGIGYFVFCLEMEILTSDILTQLTNNDFFRYFSYDPEKYKLSIKRLNEEKEIVCLSFRQIIEKYFSNLLPYIKFNYEKPIALHLFGKDSHLDLENDKLNDRFYKILRIPPEDIRNELQVNNFLERFNNKFIIGASHEGAIVIDEIVNCNQLFNKYFPSFIFSLNQREIMIQLNKSISHFNSNELDSNDEHVFEKLEKLKKKVSIFQLKQVFYSISFYDEINLFYSKLMKTFNIELLIKDNNECISEIHELTSLKHEKTKKQKDKLNSERIGLVLLILTIAQVWPNFLGVFLEEKHFHFNFLPSVKVNIVFYLSMFLVGFIFYLLILPLKSENKLTRKDFILKLKSYFIKI